MLFVGDKAIGGTPAHFVKAPVKSITVKEGEKLELSCEVKGHPVPRGRIACEVGFSAYHIHLNYEVLLLHGENID